MQPTAESYHVFISYQQETIIAAEALFRKLSVDFNVFFDKKSLFPGDNWMEKIEEAQYKSLSTIVLVADNPRSPYRESEIIIAIKLNRTNKHVIIPILIAGKLPSILSPFQSIDLKSKKIVSVAPQIKKVLTSRGIFGNNYGDSDFEEVHVDGQLRERIDEKIASLNISQNQNVGNQSNIDKNKAVSELTEKIIAKYDEENRECYVAHLDLDKFSNINRKYGETIGDMMMVDIVALMRNLVKGLYFKKVGKDEFIIFIERSRESAFNILNQIREEISNAKWKHLSPSIYMSVSIGFAKVFFPPEISDFVLITEDVLKRAAIASQTSKSQGGNTVTQGPLIIDHYLRNVKWTDFDS
jgi:diguanylate cyclase (GGDEF)-like protein